MYRWISAKTEAPIHLYIGTLQSGISYGFVKYWLATDVVLTIGNTKGYCIHVWMYMDVYRISDETPIHLHIGTLHSCTTYGYM